MVKPVKSYIRWHQKFPPYFGITAFQLDSKFKNATQYLILYLEIQPNKYTDKTVPAVFEFLKLILPFPPSSDICNYTRECKSIYAK
jgi:hypothetical protein